MKLLRQENAVLDFRGAKFNLIGVDYQRERNLNGHRTQMLSNMEPLIRRDMPNILLSHNPNQLQSRRRTRHRAFAGRSHSWRPDPGRDPRSPPHAGALHLRLHRRPLRAAAAQAVARNPAFRPTRQAQRRPDSERIAALRQSWPWHGRRSRSPWRAARNFAHRPPPRLARIRFGPTMLPLHYIHIAG